MDKLWIAFVVAGALVGVWSVIDPFSLGGPSTNMVKNTKLEGTFQSTNQELGTWKLTPRRCLAGRELGFEGMAFIFGAGDPVEDIRLGTAVAGDNTLKVTLANRESTTYSVRESECKVIEGAIKKINVTLNNLPMQRLEGDIHFDCPKHGLSGRASFSGCLPETL